MNSESQDVMGAVLVSNVATRVIVGRKTKYVVLVFWVIAFALLGSLAGKLTGVEKNDAQSWLPGKAESTKVLAAQKAFQSPNTFQAVLVATAGDNHYGSFTMTSGAPGPTRWMTTMRACRRSTSMAR